MRQGSLSVPVRKRQKSHPRRGTAGTALRRIARAGVVVVLPLLIALGGCAPESSVESSTPPSPAPDLPPEGEGFVDIALAAGIDYEHRLPGPELETLVDAVGSGAAFVDLDGDDWLDLVLVGGPRSPVSRTAADNAGVRIYRNLGGGRFENASAAAGLPADLTAVAVAVADVDGDGDRDLYFVDRGPNRLYLPSFRCGLNLPRWVRRLSMWMVPARHPT